MTAPPGDLRRTGHDLGAPAPANDTPDATRTAAVRAVLHDLSVDEVEFTSRHSGLAAVLVACRVTEARRDRGAWWVPRARANEVVRALRERGVPVEIVTPAPAAPKEVE